MALDTTGLKNGIAQLMTDMRSKDINSDSEYAERLAALLETFVKSGTGKITEGVMTAGGSSVTGTGTVKIKIE